MPELWARGWNCSRRRHPRSCELVSWSPLTTLRLMGLSGVRAVRWTVILRRFRPSGHVPARCHVTQRKDWVSTSAKRDGVQALYVSQSPVFLHHRAEIIERVATIRLPAIYFCGKCVELFRDMLPSVRRV